MLSVPMTLARPSPWSAWTSPVAAKRRWRAVVGSHLWVIVARWGGLAQAGVSRLRCWFGWFDMTNLSRLRCRMGREQALSLTADAGGSGLSMLFRNTLFGAAPVRGTGPRGHKMSRENDRLAGVNCR